MQKETEIELEKIDRNVTIFTSLVFIIICAAKIIKINSYLNKCSAFLSSKSS
jgi:hypothetical protein